MHIDSSCMYMEHVCFYVCCNDCVGICGNVCCVAAVVKDGIFFCLGVLEYVCVRGVMDVLFSVGIVTRGAGGARLWEVYVFRHADGYVCVLCASCGSFQFCVLHDFQFVNAGRGYKRRPYRRGILQRWSHDCLIGSHECLIRFTPSCWCECFYHV